MTAVSSNSQPSRHPSTESAFDHLHVPSAWRGIFATVLGAGSLLGGADPAEVYGTEPHSHGQVSASIQVETTKQIDLKNGEQATLLLDSNGSVYQIQCSAFSVTPETLLDRQLAKRYAESATKAFSRLPSDIADRSTEPCVLLSKDGYRFELLSGGRNFLLTEQRSFEIIASPEYERERFESSQTAVNELRRKLLDAVCEGLSPIQQDEIAVRIDRYCLLQDISFLRHTLAEESKMLFGHPELKTLLSAQVELTEQTLRDIESDMNQDLFLLQTSSSKRMVDLNRQILSDTARTLHIEFPDQAENTLKFLAEAVSRRILLYALNERADRIENLLEEQLENEAPPLQTQTANTLLAESRAVWDRALTALQGSSGYPAYDSKHVDASSLAEAERLIHETAVAHETALGLQSDYLNVQAKSNLTRVETEETLEQLKSAVEKALCWKIKDCTSGARGYLQEHPNDFNRYTISLNQSRRIEEYDNGNILQRSVIHKDGTRRDTLYKDGSKRLVRVFDSEGILLRQVGYNAEANNREYVSDSRRHRYTEYDSKGDRLWQVQYLRDEPELSKRVFFSGEGRAIGNYAFEKQKSSGSLSINDYVHLLAARLDSPEKLEAFFDAFFLYTSDEEEFYQTFRATVERDTSPFSDGRRLRGDCEDYAFFARDILRAQGKNAHVVGVPRHATCIWLEQDSSKRYNAYSIGTFGLDKNGYTSDSPSPPTPHTGFETPEEAINSLAWKYGSPGLGLARGQVFSFIPSSICILDVNEELREDGIYHSWREEFYKDISAFLSPTAQTE